MVDTGTVLALVGWSDAEHWMRMQVIYDVAQERRKQELQRVPVSTAGGARAVVLQQGAALVPCRIGHESTSARLFCDSHAEGEYACGM